jgi:hypothetical protein
LGAVPLNDEQQARTLITDWAAALNERLVNE